MPVQPVPTDEFLYFDGKVVLIAGLVADGGQMLHGVLPVIEEVQHVG